MATVTIGGRAYEVEVHGDVVHVDGHLYPITRRVEDGYTVIKAGDQRYRVEAPEGPESGIIDVQVDHRPLTIVIEGAVGRGGPAAAPRERAARGRVAGPKGAITAPMAGTIVKVVASVGDAVAAGDILMLMEAMKMENEIRATAAGTVTELPVGAGAKVSEGDVLAVVE